MICTYLASLESPNTCESAERVLIWIQKDSYFIIYILWCKDFLKNVFLFLSLKLRAKIISYFNSRQTCYLSNMTEYIHFWNVLVRNENCYFHIIYINVEILTILSNFWYGGKEKFTEMHSFSATLQNQLFSVLSDRFQSLQKFLTSQKIELPTFSKTCTYIPTIWMQRVKHYQIHLKIWVLLKKSFCIFEGGMNSTYPSQIYFSSYLSRLKIYWRLKK